MPPPNQPIADDNDKLDYNQIIELTVNKDPQSPPLSGTRRFVTKYGGCNCGLFQVVFMFMFIIIINTGDPLIFTLGFLTKVPNRYECLSDETGEWHDCKPKEICEHNLQEDHFRPDTTDPEYIDNWVSPQKMNLICESK
jgi:hypothetical protein